MSQGNSKIGGIGDDTKVGRYPNSNLIYPGFGLWAALVAATLAALPVE